MRGSLYRLLFVLHFSTGCYVLGSQQIKYITGLTGGSVLLPCSCAQPQSTDTTVTWTFSVGNEWIPVFDSEKFSGRHELFIERIPANLSLLISDLRKEDEGYYKCETKHDSTTILLSVTGCDLQPGAKFDVTGYSGESVVLPCSCTELLAKPEQIEWKYVKETGDYKEIYPKEELERFKNRVKLLNQTAPGNLSLHISDLTTNDRGDYRCSVPSQSSVFFRLQVEEKHDPSIKPTDRPSYTTDRPSYTRHHTQELQTPQPQHTPQSFIIMGVFLSVLLLALLTLLFWRCRVGRNVKKVTIDGEEPKKEQNHQDDVMYLAVVHVKTASTAAPTQTIPEELTEYSTIKIKQ